MRFNSTRSLANFIKLAGVFVALSVGSLAHAGNGHSVNFKVAYESAGVEAGIVHLQPVGFGHRKHHQFKRKGHALHSGHARGFSNRVYSGNRIHKKFHGSNRYFNHHKGFKGKHHNRHNGYSFRLYR